MNGIHLVQGVYTLGEYTLIGYKKIRWRVLQARFLQSALVCLAKLLQLVSIFIVKHGSPDKTGLIDLKTEMHQVINDKQFMLL